MQFALIPRDDDDEIQPPRAAALREHAACRYPQGFRVRPSLTLFGYFYP